MQTYQYFIDDIQSAVYSPETAEPDFLRDAAAQYAEACAEANQRLRQVGQLLKRGLRSEALQLTEEEPNLLDFVGMLDFPELPAWRDLLKRWGMAPPPALLIDLASDINQAYADHQPLELLIKQHRILALARAPLSARARTLRQIRRADPANMAWEEDLKIFETAQIKQLDREIDTACRLNDLAALTEIKEDLDNDGWLVSKPKTLLQKVSRFHKELSAKLARVELERLAQDLNSAHISFDVEKGFQIRQRWNEAAKTADLRHDEPLYEQAAPALDWLADQDRLQADRTKRQRAMSAIEEALEDSTPNNELHRLYEAALIFDEPIPDALKHRLEQRMAAHALASQRRHRIILASIVSSVVLVGGLVAYLTIEHSRRATVAAVADTLGSMIEQGRLDEAQQFYDRSAADTPSIASNPDVQAQTSRLADALKAQHNRSESFASAIARARAAAPTSPDHDAVSEARQLAQTADEKQSVSEIESKIEAAERQIQQEHDAAISKALADFRQRLKSAEAAGRDNSQSVESSLSGLAIDIERVKNQFPKANSAVIAQLDPLTARINAIQKSIRETKQQAEAKAAITGSVGNYTAYRAALEDFAKRFPESEIAGNMALLNQESQIWDGFFAWQQFASNFLSGDEAPSPKKVRELIIEGNQLEKSHSDIQLAELFKSRKPYLERVASREPEQGPPIIGELQKLFRDPLVGKLWIVEVKRGDAAPYHYYSRREPERKDGKVRVSYLAGFNLEEKTETIPEADVTYLDRAPQSIIAERASNLLNNMSSRDWEKNFTSVLNSVMKEEHLDPILRITLLQRVLKIAATGSSALSEGFTEFKHELDTASVDQSVSWMDPRDAKAQAERKRAEVFLGGLPSIDNSIRATALRIRQLREPVDVKYRWIGWLSHDLNNSWTALTSDTSLESGDLVIVVKPAGKAVAEPIVIGTVQKDGVHIGNESSSQLMAGRPVFVRTKLSTSK